MKKKSLVGLGIALSSVLALSACGAESGNKESQTLAALQKKYPPVVQNDGTPVQDATLKIALVGDGFKGVFHEFFSDSGPDGDCVKFAMGPAFEKDENFKIVLDSDTAPINVHIDPEEKTITYKINPKFKWNDGSPVTTTDIIKTYEICANPEFIKAAQSPRYSAPMFIIEGIEDYHDGKADHIKGLEKISESEMKIHVSEITPSVYFPDGAQISAFVKADEVEGIDMADIIECDALRKTPPSYGPYVITDVIPGESITYEANPYYIKGEPKVKHVHLEVLSPAQQVADIKNGGHDIYYGFNADTFDQVSEDSNIKLAMRPAMYYSYMGFKLGTWDADNNKVVTNPDAKLADPVLRRAMGYAIDNDAIGEKYYHGLRFRAKSTVPPVDAFKDYTDPKVEGFPYDLEKAKKILDKAGYKDVDGDGLRETPNGEPLKVNVAMMSGGETAEPLSKYYIQQWKEIGIDAGLVGGRLLEFNDFYDRVLADDPDIDVYFGAWGVGDNPCQLETYGANDMFNMPRYTSDKLQTALLKTDSNEAAMDPEFAKKAFQEASVVLDDEVPVVPLQFKMDVMPVNKRVKMFDFNHIPANGWDFSQIELTADKPESL